MSQYKALVDKINEISDLEKSAAILSWDREVMMPAAGNDARTQQLATLRRIIHSSFISDEMGELIEAAGSEVKDFPYDSNEASLIRYLKKSYSDSRKLPVEFVQRMSEITGQALPVWKEARANNDFLSFQPFLEQVIELGQEMAELYGYEDEKYDALLDKFERDATTAQVRELFRSAAEAIVPLREAIVNHGRPVDDSFLHLDYPIEKQKAVAPYLAETVGYDFSRGHLGTATHPFATSFSRDDVRITTRWYPKFINPSVFGTLHESGHAIYEQGTGSDLARTPLARGTSSGIHESQSRMMENIVGRSLHYWNTHFSRLQAEFPAPLGNVSVNQFYRAVNKVQPSYIRVEADELTYNLHIILRFELEQAMLNGELQAKDLPTAWNDKMQHLLGIVPPNDTEGCLQDIHWSSISFGYFPTYALGNLYAAQLFDAAVDQEPLIIEDLTEGNTGSLLKWLRTNIHQHGRKFTPTEIVQRATGAPLSHEAFVNYVTGKFSEIYEL
jgi:carboxypeptidase Taq